MANPIIRIKRGSGTPVSLQSGELAMDLTNKSLFVGTAEGVLAVGGEHVFAKKTYVDSAVSTETTARTAADTTLQGNIDSEVSRATAAEAANAAAITAEETARIAAVSAEASARSSADTTLQSNIDTEKGRIDAILSAADADKDSFAEIVSLINSVDTENDTAFAGYVTSNNAALAQEVTDRTAADTTLQSNIDTVSGNLSALDTRVTAAEADITTEASTRASADTTLQGNIDTEASTRASADTTLQSNIDAEASTRASADSSLSSRLDTLEGLTAGTRLTSLETDVADHETRISALETTIDGGTY